MILAGGMDMETVWRKGCTYACVEERAWANLTFFFETNSETEVARGWRSAATSL